MTPEERDALRTVGFLLTPVNQRCYHTFARNGFERETGVTDARACRWCLVGAVLLVAYHMKIDESRLRVLVRRRITSWKNAELASLWDHGTDRQRERLLRQLRTAEAN